MSLVRCPACQTVFRLQAAQLDAHGGMVRCGHCFVPFNARLNLVEPAARSTEDATQSAAEGPPHAPAATTPAADTEERPFFVLEDPVSESAETPEATPARSFAAALDALRRDDFVQPSVPPAVFRSRGDADRRDTAFAGTREEPATEEPALDPYDPLAFGVPEALPPLHTESPREAVLAAPTASAPHPAPRADGAWIERGASLPPELAAHFVMPERKSERPDNEAPPPQLSDTSWEESTPTAAVAAGTQDPDTVPPQARDDDAAPEDFASARDFVKRQHVAAEEEDEDAIRARYRPAGSAPPVTTGGRWFLGLSLGMLMGLLAAQGGYLFRDEIARQWPQTRPYLELMCAHLECTLGLPKVIDEIFIETSDLEFAPGERNSHVLNAVIRNRASFPQTVPHLELTLTDARDRAVIRRVLTPDEWLRDAPPENGLAPRATVPVRLGFNTEGVDSAVGYRLYLFYP